MGFGGISFWQLIIIAAVILVLFGTKRLRSFGEDLGKSLKGFRRALAEDETKPTPSMHNEAPTTTKDKKPHL